MPTGIMVTGGFLCLAIGGTIVAAWFIRATAVLRFGSQNPMAFNTAIAMMVTGGALIIVVGRRWPWAVVAAGVFDAALGLLVLAEYAIGHGLGIDQLVVRAYVSGPHDIPGRIALNTAVCLVVVGAGLLSWAPWRDRPQPTTLAVAGSFIAAVAIAATFGYATRTPLAYGWSKIASMAVATVATTLILGAALLGAAWRDSQERDTGLPRWLPLPAGIVALGLAAALWLSLTSAGRHRGQLDAGTAAGAATVLGLVMAGLLAVAVWLGQQADLRWRLAQAEADRRAAAEANARASEHRMFQFLDAVPAGVFIVTHDGQPYYANKEAERILGRGVVRGIVSHGIAEAYQAYVAGTDRIYPDLPVVRALRGEAAHVDDMEIRHPDGTVIPIEVWGRPVYREDGQINYGMVAFADMTERNAREETIAAQAALLDLAYDAVLVRDVDGRISYWNAGAERTYGFTRAEALGRVSHELLRTEFSQPRASIEETVAWDGRWDGELGNRCADGRAIIVDSRWASQRAADGTLLGFLEINRDVTARKAAEQEVLRKSADLEALNASLEEQVRQRTLYLERANRNLEAFTYSVAHDLRTPLRAISGFAEALVEDYADKLHDEGRDYAGRIEAASQRMAELIDSLLHLSRVTRAEITLAPVDLSAEVTAICEELQAEDPGRQVRITIQPEVVATADHDLIRTVLENLLQNAWKFTSKRPDACIEFGTRDGEHGEACCFIRDNGAGFDQAYAEKLFQPFQRLHSATEYPGTGIGLASVQRIIERHSGRVWAEGAVGSGATFHFTLAGQGS